MAQCKDCEPGSKRPAPHPGPRCATHNRAFRQDARNRSWGQYLVKTYGITAEEYWALYEHQGGLCAICRRASGKAKRLAVDHDHKTGVVRGLLCSNCNNMLGHARDSLEFFLRAHDYLFLPPWELMKDEQAKAGYPDREDPAVPRVHEPGARGEQDPLQVP